MAALSRQVYSYGLRRKRTLMQVWGYDALAFTTADWFEWASNHEPREYSWERPFLLIVPMEGPSIAFLSEQSRHLADLEATHGSLWADLRIHYAESNCDGHEHWQLPRWAMMVAETLAEQNLQRAGIGLDSPSAAVAC